MKFSLNDYREKVLGCWLGKNIGGTLGAPMEWHRQINDVRFYTQDLGGEPLPNDDLDLQLVWLLALEQRGVKIDAHDLAEYWMGYITPHYSEYGTGKANMRMGLVPPLSGTYKNDFKDSCGAFIRTEIWACMAAGMPEMAAKYAYEDAIIDHGDGEGTHAAVMIAAMQAAAFVITDFYELIKIGLAYIPEDCGVAAAVKTAIAGYEAKKTWQQTRDLILEKHRGLAFFGNYNNISKADVEKGFYDGKKGYDVPSNIAIIVAGMLYGEGDFEKTMCITVNCGEDTDCTGATVGALWGIIYGAKNIPQKWIEPIGRKIKTLCVSISELPIPIPATVDELTDRTVAMGQQLASYLRKGDFFDAAKTDVAGAKADDFLPGDDYKRMMAMKIGKVKYEFDNFVVFVDYPQDAVLNEEKQVTVGVTVQSLTRQTAVMNMQWHVPEHWSVVEGAAARAVCQQAGYREPLRMTFTLACEMFTTPTAECVLALTVPEITKKMLIPVTILNTH